MVLVFHRKCLGKRFGHQIMYAGVGGANYVAWLCALLGFIIYTGLGYGVQQWGGIVGVANSCNWHCSRLC